MWLFGVRNAVMVALLYCAMPLHLVAFRMENWICSICFFHHCNSREEFFTKFHNRFCSNVQLWSSYSYKLVSKYCPVYSLLSCCFSYSNKGSPNKSRNHHLSFKSPPPTIHLWFFHRYLFYTFHFSLIRRNISISIHETF